MNKMFKLFLLNIGIAIIAIVVYSPGLLNLRPSDPSIFKAGMSIILFLGMIFAFSYGNYLLLRQEKKQIYTKEKMVDITEAVSILEKYKEDGQLGSIANTAIGQVDRINRSILRAETEIRNKFEPSSMSYEKYYGVVSAAGEVALKNLASLANRLQLYDPAEYERLKSSYRNDNIPDEIQEKQLKLFEKNKSLASMSISKNEELILNLDTLAMELTSSNEFDGAEGSDTLLTTIQTLTNEVKYYI